MKFRNKDAQEGQGNNGEAVENPVPGTGKIPILPTRIESIGPEGFKAFLDGNEAITDILIHANGDGAEVRTIASHDNGGVSRFRIGKDEAGQMEQIAKDAGFERLNPGMDASMFLRRKR